ncbi:hypothetical protein V500_00280 [Pseudogymnoascus sp. VKM F-4518 (FW-2643)]|nr:hypothetical protein V500_00280 [Pseudogymnoascus sp. VKM F-4518 (FW-2643)]
MKLRREIEAEMKKKMKAAAAAAAAGPSEAQRLRQVDLLKKKAQFKQNFPIIHERIADAKAAVDNAVKWYEDGKGFKHDQELQYSAILAVLKSIPVDWETEIARHGRPQPPTLSLSLLVFLYIYKRDSLLHVPSFMIALLYFLPIFHSSLTA